MSTYMVFTRDKTLEVPATLAGMTSNFSLFYGAELLAKEL
jgi:hypothetical protein